MNKVYYRVRWRLAGSRARLRELESGLRRRYLRGDTGADRGEVPIFFVVGRGRSGTNWLMRTLDCHPEVMCRGEGRFFGRGLRRESLKEMQTTEHLKHKLQPASLYNAIAESEYLRLWIERSVWTRDGDVEEHVNRLTRAAIHHFLGEKLSESGKSMVGDKTPLVDSEVIEEIARICPEAKVIHIIRDGRDVAVSMTHFLWNRATDQGGIYEIPEEERARRDRYWEDPRRFLESGEGIFTEASLRKIAREWRSIVEETSRKGPELLGGNYVEVRYEDLLQRPRGEFGSLFGFLGAANDEKTVSRCVGRTGFKKSSGGRERGEEDARSGVRKGIAGDWKNVFTGRDCEIFSEEAGDLLARLGYEASDDR